MFRLAILVDILWGAQAWFTWGLQGVVGNIALIIIFLISLYYCQVQRIKLKKSSNVLFPLFVLFIAYVIGNKFSIPLLLGTPIRIFPLWVLLSDKQNKYTLQYIVNILYWIFLIGLITYFVLLYYNFPGYPISYDRSLSYSFFNYGFMLQSIYIDSIHMYRFHSVFLEPSYAGTLISFLLYAGKFDFSKKGNVLMLIVELFTFSLAGYVITFVGYVIYCYSQHSSIRKYIYIALFIFGMFYVSNSYNDGDNIVNKLIVERLTYDEEKGIAGNNRSGEAVDFYLDRLTASGNLLWGLGVDEVNHINGKDNNVDKSTKIHGAGYKIYIVTHGLLPAMVWLLFYYMIAAKNCRNRRYGFGFVILIFLTFLQAAYPDSYSWMIPFILGIGVVNES